MDEPNAAQATTPAAEEITNAQVYKRLLKQIRLIRTQHKISVAEAFQRFGGPGIDLEYRRLIVCLQADIEPPVLTNELTEGE